MRKVVIWLSLIMIFMMPWEDAITINTLGSLTRLTGFVVAGFWVLTVLAAGRVRKWHAFHIAVLLFVVWNVASGFWTLGVEETTYRIKTYAQLFVMVLLIWDLYDTPAALKSGLQAYVLGAWVAVISTIGNYVAGREFRFYAEGRYSATGVNPGDFVLILTLALPVAWYLATSGDHGVRGRVARLVNYAYVPSALFAIALSGARMALFAVVPALLYILATTTRLKFGMKALLFCFLITTFLALPVLLPEASLDRLSTVGTSISEGDLGGRVILWRAGVAEFARHPLLGVGSGAFPAVAEFHSVVHNTFLSVLTEVGIIGFVLFAMCWSHPVPCTPSAPGAGQALGGRSPDLGHRRIRPDVGADEIHLALFRPGGRQYQSASPRPRDSRSSGWPEIIEGSTWCLCAIRGIRHCCPSPADPFN